MGDMHFWKTQAEEENAARCLAQDKIRELEQRLQLALNEVDAVRFAAQNTIDGLNSQVKDYREEVSRLIGEVGQLSSEAQRHFNRLAICARALPFFIEDFLATYAPFKREALTAEYKEKIQTATELVALLEQYA